MRIYLLQPYQNHDTGEIISVSNDVAFGLIDQKAARHINNRDFLVKPEFGVSKAINTHKITRK